IYNDINVAIRFLCRKYHIRVLYIDTDAHHGDGVQWEFYQDPNVLTVSFHETGRFLFPGTGWLNERGKKEGYGYCVNVPLEPFTDDASFLECFREVLPPLVEAYQPDLIISQNGCDAHFYDSLTHLNLSINAYQEIPRLVHQLAHGFSGGKWLALGGGGYDPFRVVARAWVLLWAEAAGLNVSERIPQSWQKQWQRESPFPLPQTLFDSPEFFLSVPHRQEIAEKNLRTARQAVQDTLIILNKYI
ncbi:MAG: acetoin utilization protein AcuC, partial [Clostridia bacterium]|nr:acetoin utilization protein AcuC [Clostridia bacterium]